jgi:chemotaxis protein MotA
MSLSSLLGVIFGLALIFFAVGTATGNPLIYLDLHALLIVGGGSIAAAFMGYHSRDVFTAFKAIWWMVKKPTSTREGLNTEIMRLIKWSYLVQQRGVIALENEIKTVPTSDPIIRYCMELVVSNHPPAELKAMMITAVESSFEHKTAAVQVLRNMGASAPSFGMIGTLVGLIAILNQLGGGAKDLPAVVGSGMSLALVATLYGVFAARMLFIPAANKLMQKEETERFRNLMVVEGLALLADKKSPRFMQDRLNSFLEPKDHFDIDRQLRGNASLPTVPPTSPPPAQAG